MKLHLAIPLLNEYENLPGLIRSLAKQTFQNFDMVFCINQMDSWWEDNERETICDDNQRSIQYLRSVLKIDLMVIDRSSKGSGWKGKKGGVGWARKEAMDLCDKMASPFDVIVSMDADTEYPEDYLASIVKSFSENKKAIGMSVPYYHKLTNEVNDRLILRYEIYMRYYLLNMFRINNPYAFTALGSAMAVPVWAYRKAGGMTPVKSGEDFYFLQKLVKSGKLLIWADTLAYPSTRFSDRVFFGTGPALIKGNLGDWSSYPIYDSELFDAVKETYVKFPDLFIADLPLPMTDFLMKQFNTADLWSALRKNYVDRENFVKACMTKVDGLRILQFLKSGRKKSEKNSKIKDTSVYDGLNQIIDLSKLNIDYSLPVEKLPFSVLSDLRELLFEKEQLMRKKIKLTGI